jgi:hypothetical protein
VCVTVPPDWTLSRAEDVDAPGVHFRVRTQGGPTVIAQISCLALPPGDPKAYLDRLARPYLGESGTTPP